MTTWAQIVNNTACDVHVGSDLSQLMVPGYSPNNTAWVEVPDGTLSGATTNDGKTFTNPVPYVAPNPTTITGLQFVKRFTAAERAAIINSADPLVKAFSFELQIAAAGGDVSLLDADTVAGVNYLGTASLIAANRVAQILTP